MRHSGLEHRDDAARVAQSQRTGDRAPLGGVLERHEPCVRGTVSCSGCPEAERDDVVQDVLAKVYESRLTGFDPSRAGPGGVCSYVCGIARFKALGALRWYGRGQGPVEPVAERPATAVDPADVADRGEAVARLREALLRLPPTDAQIVILSFGHGFGAEKIGTLLGITSVAARIRKHRAIKRLRGLLR